MSGHRSRHLTARRAGREDALPPVNMSLRLEASAATAAPNGCMAITANVREGRKRLWFIKNPIKINLRNKKSPCAAYELRTGFVAQQNYNVTKDMSLEGIQELCQPNEISE